MLLLDAGPRFDPATDYPLTDADWDARDFPEKPGSTGKVTFAPGQKLSAANRCSHREAAAGAGCDRRHAIDGQISSRPRHRRHYVALHRGVAPPPSRGDEDEDPLWRGRGLADRLRRTRAVLRRGRGTDRRRGPGRRKARAGARADFRLPPHPLSYAAHTLGKGAAKRSASTGRPTAAPRCRCLGMDASPAITAAPATTAVRAATRAAPT